MGASSGDLGKKSLLLVAANWTGTALGFLAAVLVARRLGPEAVGALGYGFGLIGVVAAVLLPGFAQAHTKRVAERRDLGRCLAAMGAIQLGLQTAMVVAVLAAIWARPGLIPPGIPLAVIYLMLGHRVATNLATTFGGALLGRQWVGSLAFVLMGSRAARLVATLFVLAWWPDVRAVAATYALEGTLELALGAWAVYVRRGARPVRPDAETLRAYWAYARPLLVTSPIGLLQDSLDRVLVARWAGLQAAGYYQVARGLWEVLGTLNAQPFNLLFARLSQLFARRDARGDEEARRLFTSAVDKLLFLAVPAGFLLWALRVPVIGLLYGPAFLPAQGALMIFVLAAIAQAAVNPYHFVIYALEQHARFIPVVFVRFGLYLATMVVAVPMWGGSGAAAVRLLLVLVPAWVFVRWTRELAGIGVERVTWVYAAGFGLLVLVSEGMRAALAGVDAPLAIPAAILVATAVYAGWLRLAHPGAGAHLRYARGLVWPPGWAGRGS